MTTNPPRSKKTELPLHKDSEIERLVDEFEALTLPSENWTHRAHLAVAVYYLRKLAFCDALAEIRRRINAYSLACGDPNGYNETITVMFLRKIAADSKNAHCCDTMHSEVTRLEVLCRVEWLYQYYSRELILSSTAKKCWVEPDLSQLNF